MQATRFFFSTGHEKANKRTGGKQQRRRKRGHSSHQKTVGATRSGSGSIGPWRSRGIGRGGSSWSSSFSVSLTRWVAGETLSRMGAESGTCNRGRVFAVCAPAVRPASRRPMASTAAATASSWRNASSSPCRCCFSPSRDERAASDRAGRGSGRVVVTWPRASARTAFWRAVWARTAAAALLLDSMTRDETMGLGLCWRFSRGWPLSRVADVRGAGRTRSGDGVWLYVAPMGDSVWWLMAGRVSGGLLLVAWSVVDGNSRRRGKNTQSASCIYNGLCCSRRPRQKQQPRGRFYRSRWQCSDGFRKKEMPLPLDVLFFSLQKDRIWRPVRAAFFPSRGPPKVCLSVAAGARATFSCEGQFPDRPSEPPRVASRVARPCRGRARLGAKFIAHFLFFSVGCIFRTNRARFPRRRGFDAKNPPMPRQPLCRQALIRRHDAGAGRLVDPLFSRSSPCKDQTGQPILEAGSILSTRTLLNTFFGYKLYEDIIGRF